MLWLDAPEAMEVRADFELQLCLMMKFARANKFYNW